jgi:hypothetical protein
MNFVETTILNMCILIHVFRNPSHVTVIQMLNPFRGPRFGKILEVHRDILLACCERLSVK